MSTINLHNCNDLVYGKNGVKKSGIPVTHYLYKI